MVADLIFGLKCLLLPTKHLTKSPASAYSSSLQYVPLQKVIKKEAKRKNYLRKSYLVDNSSKWLKKTRTNAISRCGRQDRYKIFG